jgi:hypothetical protein
MTGSTLTTASDQGADVAIEVRLSPSDYSPMRPHRQIDSFALDPSLRGQRRLRATWTPPRVHVNGPDPSPLSIDGTVSGL